jgi:hypothetical protein
MVGLIQFLSAAPNFPRNALSEVFLSASRFGANEVIHVLGIYARRIQHKMSFLPNEM